MMHTIGPFAPVSGSKSLPVIVHFWPPGSMIEALACFVN
jgi:hypothetical protein